MPQTILTKSILESLRTKFGGYNKKTLVLIGVGWPPYKNWKKKLVGTSIDSHLLSLAHQSSGNMLPIEVPKPKSYKEKYVAPKYPQIPSKFEIQSFIYSSLKDDFDIKGELYSDFNSFDLVIFKNKIATLVINILREDEVYNKHPMSLPTRIIYNMTEAKELVLTIKKIKLS